MISKPTYEELEQRVQELEKQNTSFKKNEARLQFFSSLVKQSDQGMAVIDLDGYIIFVNEAFAAMHGYIPDELIKKHLSIFHTSEQMLSVEEANRLIKETGEFKGEIWHLHRNGTSFPTIMNNSLLKDENGTAIGMIGTLVDITDRKQAEEAMRESEEHLKRIFDTAPGGIVVVDHTGKITTVNTAAEEILGLTRSKDTKFAYNDPAWKITAVDGGPFPEEELPFVRVMKTGAPVYSIEHAIEHPDGRRVILSINGAPFKDAFGNIAGIIAGITDITERKQAEEKSRYDETLLRHVLDTSPAVIFVKDRDSTILLANSKMASFYNLSVEEVTGRRQSDLHAALGVCPEEVEKWLADDREVIDTGIIKHLLETGTDSSNCQLWFETDKYPIDIGEGRRGVLIISHDITERKQAELSLKEKRKELENKTHELEEVNAALKVLLKQRDKDKKEFEEKIIANLKNLVFPYVDKLNSSRLNDRQTVYLDIIKSNLEDVIAPFLPGLSSKYSDLTPSEIQVAGLVKDGKTTKEIAELLNSSTGAIDFHRNNLRKKLGLRNTKANLRSFLLSFT